MRLLLLLLSFPFFLLAGCDVGGGEDFNKPIVVVKKKKKRDAIVLKKEEAPKPQAQKILPEYFIESKNALKAFEQPENEKQKAEPDSKESAS